MELERVHVEMMLDRALAAGVHKGWPAIPGHELAELCRVWLAVDGAPAVDPGTITLAKPVKLLAIPEDDTHAHD